MMLAVMWKFGDNMATLEFGNATTKIADDYIKEIYEAIGVKCPLTVIVDNGVLKQVIVETEWKEGSPTPKKVINGEGKAVIDYEENYEEKELTESQIADLNNYLQENLVL